MKKFADPIMEVEVFVVNDIIATSDGCAEFSCPNDTGCPLD